MKRIKQISSVLVLLTLLCAGWRTALQGYLTQQASTALTSALNQQADQLKAPINYFKVQAITFEKETSQKIGDQRQREFAFSYNCVVVSPANGYQEGDEFKGRARALFVADEESENWQIHWLKLE